MKSFLSCSKVAALTLRVLSAGVFAVSLSGCATVEKVAQSIADKAKAGQSTDAAPAATTESSTQPTRTTRTDSTATAPNTTTTDKAASKPAADPAKGAEVKGKDGAVGTVIGTPVRGSPFVKVRVGMTDQEVVSTIGPPTYRNEYRTGKSFIPFWQGGGTREIAFHYKSFGRLLFSLDCNYCASYALIQIEHDAKEGGSAQ